MLQRGCMRCGGPKESTIGFREEKGVPHPPQTIGAHGEPFRERGCCEAHAAQRWGILVDAEGKPVAAEDGEVLYQDFLLGRA